ncbi:MAG: ABC transporter ATP-binding protein [Planctomycetota bacterium]
MEPTIQSPPRSTQHAARSTASADWALDVRNVSKVYKGKVRALAGIDMQVAKGEVFGLLGPNGAGKSTLVKIITTVIRPTTVGGHVLGAPVGKKSTLARVGYLPEHHRFPEYLTGRQVVEFFGAMSGVRRAQRKAKAAELIDFVGMSDWANRRVGTYSKGMRQRVGIAQALVNSPDLIILDEPTDGVDPIGRRDIRVMVQRLKAAGKTVFLNSHLLSELEMVCDRVAILVKGEVARQGSLDELTRDRKQYEIEIVGDPAEAQLVLTAILEAMSTRWHGEVPKGWEGCRWLDSTAAAAVIREGVLRVRGDDPATVQPIIDTIRRAGHTIKLVKPFRPSLEDLFMEAIIDQEGREMTPGAAMKKKGDAK